MTRLALAVIGGTTLAVAVWLYMAVQPSRSIDGMPCDDWEVS